MSALMPASFWAVEVWPVFSTKQGQTVSCDKMIAEELDCQLNITTSGCREKYNTNGEQYPIGVPESTHPDSCTATSAPAPNFRLSWLRLGSDIGHPMNFGKNSTSDASGWSTRKGSSKLSPHDCRRQRRSIADCGHGQRSV